MGKVVVGAFALHRPTGRAGVVLRIFEPGRFQPTGSVSSPSHPELGAFRGARIPAPTRSVVELSTGDALLLDSAEFSEDETWLVLSEEGARAAQEWLAGASEEVARRLALGVRAGLSPEWVEKLLVGVAARVGRALQRKERDPDDLVDKSGATP